MILQEEQARKERIELQRMIENDKVAYQNHHRFSRAVKKIVAMYRDLEVGGALTVTSLSVAIIVLCGKEMNII